MPEISRINIKRGQTLYPEIEEELIRLASLLREKYHAARILVFGSYVSQDLHEGSDIDLLIVGDFHGRFHERCSLIRDLTDLPVETHCYTQAEFEDMKKAGNLFILEVLKKGQGSVKVLQNDPWFTPFS